MIAFAVGFLVGIGLSCVVAWFAASHMRAEFEADDAFLRQSRDSLSDALKERNDALFQLRAEHKKALAAAVEMSKEVIELRNLRGELIHKIKELLEQQ